MTFLRRLPPWAWALLFALALCLPRLGSFGFWDPWELGPADQARQMAETGNLLDPTVDGKFNPQRPLQLFMAALGIKLFGANEWGARLFLALAAVGALMAVYWAGRSLFRVRAALLATVALGTMTSFALQARQLTSSMAITAALALTLGGLGRFAWPADGRRRTRDLLVALAGMFLASAAGGALLGIALPCLALSAALLVGFGLTIRGAPEEIEDETAELAALGVGPHLPAGKRLGDTTFKPGSESRGHAAVFWLLAIVGVVTAFIAFVSPVANKDSFWLGGTPKGGVPVHLFEVLVRNLGFGLFPWSAAAVFALARPLVRIDDEDRRTNSRLVFGGLFVLFFAGLAFALSTYLDLIFGEARYVALPAIALALGAFLDDLFEGRRAEPVLGLLIAVGTMIVARDFYLDPQELGSVHLFDKVRWPSAVHVGNAMLAFGLLVSLGLYACCALRGAALGRVPAPPLTTGGKLDKLRAPVVKGLLFLGRDGLGYAVGVAVVYVFWLTQGVVPTLSKHFSFKPVLESYAKYAGHGEPIGKYHVEGRSGGFYGGAAMVELPSQDKVVEFLRAPGRVFALVSADELAPLDAAFKQARQSYAVVDASSSRFLLLSNQLSAEEKDHNPLLENVRMATSENEPSPWPTSANVQATFADSIELVGARFPASVHRPTQVKLELVFRVRNKPPGSYKIFVHLDGPAAPRVLGDHDPLNKTFPTTYWLPGEWVRDVYDIDVPLMTTPAGSYTIFVGFWPGGEGKRLHVTQGPNDGSDRVRVGTIEIK